MHMSVNVNCSLNTSLYVTAAVGAHSDLISTVDKRSRYVIRTSTTVVWQSDVTASTETTHAHCSKIASIYLCQFLQLTRDVFGVVSVSLNYL
jgi:hypothetical protein